MNTMSVKKHHENIEGERQKVNIEIQKRQDEELVRAIDA